MQQRRLSLFHHDDNRGLLESRSLANNESQSGSVLISKSNCTSSVSKHATPPCHGVLSKHQLIFVTLGCKMFRLGKALEKWAKRKLTVSSAEGYVIELITNLEQPFNSRLIKQSIQVARHLANYKPLTTAYRDFPFFIQPTPPGSLARISSHSMMSIGRFLSNRGAACQT